MSDVSPMSEISGLSFDSTLPSPFVLFCLLPLPYLSCLFSAYWPILLTFFQRILQYFSLRDRIFSIALLQQLGDDDWLMLCAACWFMAQVFIFFFFAFMALYNILHYFIVSAHSFIIKFVFGFF